MADTAGLTLKEPQQIDWDNYNPGKKYQAPPPAKGGDGKAIVYTGQLPNTIGTEQDNDGYRRYTLDPIKLIKNGNGVDGYVIRFTRASVKPFEKNGKVQNASAVGNVLRSAGVSAKPQRTAEYDAAMNAVKGRVISFTVDWEARNKETGETVRGYDNFPNDPDRPGQKKAILRGARTSEDGRMIPADTYRDKEGNVQTVSSEVLFANARVRYFVDPSRK